MKTRKLNLEISQSLYEQLNQLSDLTEETIESLIIRILAGRLPSLITEAKELNEMLDGITSENLHDEIDYGEPVGREVF